MSSITAISTAAASSYSSASLPICNKISTNPSLESSLIPITSHFTLTPNPKLTLKIKIKTHYHSLSLLSRSALYCASAAFDNFETTQETQITETPETEAEEEEDEAVESQSAEAGRLYVGNLPYALTSSQLAEIFGEAGRVVTAEIVYDRVTDRSRGFAFVTMGSVEEAKVATRMFDGSQIGSRTVKVNFPEVPKGGEREVMGPKIRSSYKAFIDSPYKIYAGNLSWGVNAQGLREFFANQPGLVSAKVIYDRDSGRSQGFGFVSFASAEEVESALNAMNGVEVEGRPLRLNLAKERASPSLPPRLDTNSENNVGTGEMLSSISTQGGKM